MRFLNSSYSLYKKMLLYTLVLVAGVILLQSIVLNRYFERTGAQITFDANLNILSQISYSANYMNDAARSFAATIYSDPKNLPLMYGDTVNADDVYSRMKDIDTMVNQSPYIYSVYLYNGARREFYSTTVWNTIASADQFYDRDMADRLTGAKFPADYSFHPIPRQIPLNGYRGADQLHTGVFTYVVYERFYNSDQIQNAIVVNVKVDYLAGVINALKTKGAPDTQQVVIATGDRLLTDILQSGRSAAEDEALLREINQTSGKSGYFKSTASGRDELVTFVSSDILDWKFVSTTPYSSILQNMDRVRLVTFAVCLAVVLLGFVLTYFVTRHLYSPIRRIVGKVEGGSEASVVGQELSDIALLSKAFDDGIESVRKLQVAHQEKSIREKQQALSRLLTDESADPATIRSDRVFERWQLALDPERPAFVCSFAFDGEAEFQSRYSLQDQQLFGYMVGNVAGELMGEAFRHEPVIIDHQRMILILQLREPSVEGKAEAEAALLAERVQSWFAERLGLSLTAAIGYEVPSLGMIGSSYRSAMELAKYRLLYGHRSVLTPERVEPGRMSGFERPVALEKQLGDQLLAGKLEEALKHYEAIVAYIVRYGYDDVASYLLYLSYFLYMKANELENRGYEKLDLDFSRFTGEIMACETLDQVGARFGELFAAMTEIVRSKKFKRKNALAEKIVRMLETRYTDPALCQESVASELNVSRDYIGRIFKETYGRTFAEYMNEIRLNRAAHELTTTTKSIAEITKDIGWENKNYFYTMFKARFGMTTSEYRTKNSP